MAAVLGGCVCFSAVLVDGFVLASLALPSSSSSKELCTAADFDTVAAEATVGCVFDFAVDAGSAEAATAPTDGFVSEAEATELSEEDEAVVVTRCTVGI